MIEHGPTLRIQSVTLLLFKYRNRYLRLLFRVLSSPCHALLLYREVLRFQVLLLLLKHCRASNDWVWLRPSNNNGSCSCSSLVNLFFLVEVLLYIGALERGKARCCSMDSPCILLSSTKIGRKAYNKPIRGILGREPRNSQEFSPSGRSRWLNVLSSIASLVQAKEIPRIDHTSSATASTPLSSMIRPLLQLNALSR